MNAKLFFSLLLLSGSMVAPLATVAEQLVPAGSIMQCTVSEPKLSSKTENIGDPVLCQVSHVELYGRSAFPYGSYLIGHFEDYRDPGHFVGKGWMELKFDRLVVQPDTIVPIEARVVATPKYPVDKEGRIHGTGHPVRDIVEWSIPLLWPIDLINLPRRGPRPVLKPETRLTLKVLDDFGIPTQEEAAVRQPALISRQPAPAQNYAPPASVQGNYGPPPQQPSYGYQQSYPQTYVPPAPQYVQPSVVYVQAPPVIMQSPVVYGYPPPPPPMYAPYGYGPRYAAPAYRGYYGGPY